MSLIEKIAAGQAEFDGRELIAMPRVERERYMERARLALKAMQEPPEAFRPDYAHPAFFNTLWRDTFDAVLKEASDASL